MSALDIVVLTIIGVASAFGFMRGFVKEAMTLVAWLAAIGAIKVGLTPLTVVLEPHVGIGAGAAVLAFILLFGVTLIGGKILASVLGRHSRESMLGPFDRVLGAGFGMVKGLIAATLLFLLVSTASGYLAGEGDAEPEWLSGSRSTPLLRSLSQTLVDYARHERAAP